MDITVYTKKNCVQCVATARRFKTHGISPDEYTDVTPLVEPGGTEETERNYRKFKERFPDKVDMPVVVIDGDTAWMGFHPDKIKNLATPRQPARV